MSCPQHRSNHFKFLFLSFNISQLSYLIFTLTLCSLLIPSVLPQTILLPGRLNVGQNNSLLLISNSDSFANIAISHGKDVWLSQKVLFRKNQIISHPLFLDPNKDFNHRAINGTLEGQFSADFENGHSSERPVQIHLGGGSTFFQTDKPIYRTEETVKFRILRLDPHMKPINEPVKLSIYNPQNVKFEEVLLKTDSSFHLASYSFNFPFLSKIGEWRAEAQYGSNFQSKEILKFELANYDLPNFNVKIHTPRYLLRTKTPTFEVKVNVDYTYDRILNGTIYFKVGYIHNEKFQYLQTTNVKCFTKGSFAENITLTGVWAKQMMVETIVRDCSTNNIRSITSDIIEIVPSPYIISTKNTVKLYRSQTPSHVVFEVLDPTGKPVENVPVKVTLKALKRNLSLSSSIVSENPNKRTDSNGRYVLIFKVENVGKIDVRIETVDPNLTDEEQAHSKFLLELFDPEVDELLYIVERRHSIYKADTEYESSISTNHQFTSMYLIVSSKGQVYHYEKLQSNRIKFKITNQMSPSVRVLVMGVKSDMKIVADYVHLNVKQENCGPTVSLVSAKTVFPGANVRFSVKGKKDDVIGFHAVDEAVYALMNNDKLQKDGFRRFEKLLSMLDSGCGPGNTENSPRMIRNAGFIVLSTNQQNENHLNNCPTERSSPHRSRRELSQNELLGRMKREQFLKKCCDAADISIPNVSCKRRADFIRKHYDEECKEEFQKCCARNNLRKTASAPDIDQNRDKSLMTAGTGTSNDNTHALLSASAISAIFKDNSVEKMIDSTDSSSDESFQTKTRTDFRETWLFDMFRLEDDHKTVTQTAPDSITSWAVSTISLSERDGFCYGNELRVTTFKNFFAELNLPNTMVEMEQTELNVNVFNYEDRQLYVSVTFYRLDGICSNWGVNKEFVVLNGSIDGYGSRQFNFAVLPYRKGTLQVKVNVNASMRHREDTIVKNFTVLPRGIEKTELIQFEINPLKKKRSVVRLNNILVDQMSSNHSTENQHTTNLILTSDSNKTTNLVENTLKYVLFASGQNLFVDLSTSDKKIGYIRKPFSDGMNNINMMAHNLYAMQYINSTNKLRDSRKKEAIELIKKAFQNQLAFREEDGSFYIFQIGSKPSSHFTAYVTKVFCQAAPHLGPEVLDPKLVFQSLKYLYEKQSQSGSWSESHPFDSEAENDIDSPTLTAYIVGAIQQCSQYIEANSAHGDNEFNKQHYDAMINKAELFIEKTFNAAVAKKKKEDSQITNNLTPKLLSKSWPPFQLAMFAYALSFGKKKQLTETLLTKCMEPSLTVNGDRKETYWPANIEPYNYDTAALMLMVFVQTRGEISKMIPIANWLNNKTKLDDFKRTIDQTIGLEAMAKFYSHYKQAEANYNKIKLDSNVHFDHRLRTKFHFDQSNADLVQFIEVDPGTRNISIVTQGFGVSTVNLQKIFNEFNPSDACSYDLEIKFKDYVMNTNEMSFAQSASDSPDSIFNTGPDVGKSLKKEFAPTEITEDVLQRTPTTCCYKSLKSTEKTHSKRRKRHVSWTDRNFWRKLWHSRKRYFTSPQNSVEQTMSTGSQTSSANTNEYPPDTFPELPKNFDNNIIKVLNICTRHLQQGGAGFTLIEVNMLSGYEVILPDLHHSLNRTKYMSTFDVAANKVKFYFRDIPSTIKECFWFRVVEKSKVISRHPALVQAFRLDTKTVSCARLYWDHQNTKSARAFNYSCKGQDSEPLSTDNQRDIKSTCQCRSSMICPNWIQLTDVIGTYSNGDFGFKRRADMEKWFCKYKTAFIGRIESKKKSSNNQPHSVLINVTKTFGIHKSENEVGEEYPRKGNTQMIKLNSNCTISLDEGKNVLVLHNYLDDWLLDGDSLFTELDNANMGIMESFSKYIEKVAFSCP